MAKPTQQPAGADRGEQRPKPEKAQPEPTGGTGTPVLKRLPPSTGEAGAKKG